MISVSQLSKSYGDLQALNSISFEIKAGELFGLLGPNGAGKTTTLSILSTLLKPDSGQVKMAGFDLRSNPMEIKKVIGVVPQEIALYEDLTAMENLLFWGGLYGLRHTVLKERAIEILQMLGLHDRRDDRIRTYSGGMKRRINIASALLHSPKILFMDEPTVGIDPHSRNLIFEVVERLHKEGLTIIYTTHYMEEAERLCDRIGIIDRGQILALGTLAELRSRKENHESLVFGIRQEGAEIEAKMKDFQGWDWTLAGQSLVIRSGQARTDLPGVISRINQTGLEILQIDIREIGLEAIFLDLTGRQLRD